MKHKQTINFVVYGILIMLALAAAGLAVVSPSAFTNLKLVYGGF
jgi:hypothetical protein